MLSSALRIGLSRVSVAAKRRFLPAASAGIVCLLVRKTFAFVAEVFHVELSEIRT